MQDEVCGVEVEPITSAYGFSVHVSTVSLIDAALFPSAITFVNCTFLRAEAVSPTMFIKQAASSREMQ